MDGKGMRGGKTYEMVDHPPHYNWHPVVEAIDVVEHFSFNIGSVIKYLWRVGRKPKTEAIQDLRKAQWYIQREIERIERIEEGA